MRRTPDTGCHDMKRRTEDEITALILGATNKPTMRKTRIMCEAFLSYCQIKEYLALLTEKRLLEYQKGKMTYRTTENGKRFLENMYIQEEIS
jgi:predicted transcriptional regulator